MLQHPHKIKYARTSTVTSSAAPPPAARKRGDKMTKEEKYGCAGVYTISINETLVYVGKSHNMLRRLTEHIEATRQQAAHKYKILN